MARSRLFSAVRSSTSQRLISDGTTSTARGAALARRAMRGAVVEQPRVAFAPHRRRIVESAMDRMPAIGQHAVGQPLPCGGRSRDEAPPRTCRRRPWPRGRRSRAGGPRPCQAPRSLDSSSAIRASRASTRFRSSPTSSAPCPDEAAADGVPAWFEGGWVRRARLREMLLGPPVSRDATWVFAAAKRRAICSVSAWSEASPASWLCQRSR